MRTGSGGAAILVDQPRRAIQDLRDEVKALGVADGIDRSLTTILDAAAKALARTDGSRVAIRMLEAFIKEVNRQGPRRIPEESAAEFRQFVREIVDLLNGVFATFEDE